MAFKPGQSGNPNGRPKKGKTMTDLLEKFLNQPVLNPRDSTKTIKRKLRLIEKVYDLAMEGDATALKYIFDRIDGKPIETNRITGAEGDPIRVNINVMRKREAD